MIDKITPGPDDGVRKMLLDCGFDAGTHSRFTPFVNAEETQYLVIEDHFPAGRPPLEKAGVIFTDRETVDKVEKMKVCTCLNPLHTALAIFGCLLGYTRISDEMQDADLVALIERIVYREGLPVVVDPGIIDPRAFLGNVLRVRFPNPFMPDTPQRIAMDTSQKLPIRFGETIKAYQAHPELQATQLEYIPLVFAAWLRYLMGVNDAGDAFEISADPRGEELSARAAQLTLGNVDNAAEVLEPILRDAEIFGQDLVKAGLSEKVLHHFAKMAAGAGAVRQTLHEMVSS